MRKVLAASPRSPWCSVAALSSASGPPDTGPIQVFVSGSPDEIDAFRAIIEAYKKAKRARRFSCSRRATPRI